MSENNPQQNNSSIATLYLLLKAQMSLNQKKNESQQQDIFPKKIKTDESVQQNNFQSFQPSLPNPSQNQDPDTHLQQYLNSVPQNTYKHKEVPSMPNIQTNQQPPKQSLFHQLISKHLFKPKPINQLQTKPTEVASIKQESEPSNTQNTEDPQLESQDQQPSNEEQKINCIEDNERNEEINIKMEVKEEAQEEGNKQFTIPLEICMPNVTVKTTSNSNNKGSAAKNYIALICTGFARVILASDEGGEIQDKVRETVEEQKEKIETLQSNPTDEMVQTLKDLLFKDFLGKKVKSTKGRDFKIRNTDELDNVLTIKKNDSDINRFKKECYFELLNFFFNSNYYDKWLSNGMISDVNKSFFIANKKEIHKKFQQPGTYKPRFTKDESSSKFGGGF